MKEIELLKIIFKDSPDILEPLNKIDKEIERLNNIIEEYKNANEYHQNIIHELETMKQPNQLYSENVKLRSENKRLNNIIEKLEQENAVLKTQVVNKNKYSYGIRMGSDKEWITKNLYKSMKNY